MTTSTNRIRRLRVSGDSFQLNSNPYIKSKITRPKSSTVRQRRPKTGLRPLQPELENIPLDTSSPVLEGVVIYFDKSVMNQNRFIGMANALAATVLEYWTPSVTHLIHGPIVQHSLQQGQQHSQQNYSSKRHQGQRIPPIISKSFEKKMRVVSPSWISACYNNNERMPEALYPYEMNSHLRMTSLRHESSSDFSMDENPFGLEPDEFATIESCDEGDPVANDRRVTDYFKPTNNNPGIKDNSARVDQHDDPYTETNYSEFDDEPNNTSNNNGNNDHSVDMSYSLIEMSQVRPEQLQPLNDIPQPQPPQNQSDCAYGQSSAGECQSFKVGSLQPPTTASGEGSVQQMEAMDEGSQTSPNNKTMQKPTVNEAPPSFSVLPELPPGVVPKVMLGREDRLQIWYGEQSFCLDAGEAPPKKRNKKKDSTHASLPPQANVGQLSATAATATTATESSAPTASSPSTSKPSTTTNQLEESHQ